MSTVVVDADSALDAMSTLLRIALTNPGERDTMQRLMDEFDTHFQHIKLNARVMADNDFYKLGRLYYETDPATDTKQAAQ